MKRKSVELTIIFGLITLIQLVTQIVVVRLFGATFQYDAFLAAVALPSVIVTVIYGTLSDAFMPLYSGNDGEGNKSRYFGQVISTLFVIGFIFSGLIYFVVPFLQPILFSGTNKELFLASLPLFRTMIWLTPFAIVTTIIGSTWYYHKHFSRFPFAQLLGAAASILVTVLLFQYIGIWSLVVGFLVGVLSQFLIVAPGAKISLSAPDFKVVLTLLLSWLPLIISSFAVRSDTLIMRSFGSELGEGQLVYINLVSRMYSLGSGIVTIGIQVLLLPTLLERFSQKKYQEASSLVNKTKIVGILLSVGSSLAILLLGPLVIRYLFIGGKFTLADFAEVEKMFPIFLLPSFAWGLNSIFFQPLIALKKSWTLGIINSVSLGLSWFATQYLFALGYGLWAISIGLCVLLFGGIITSEIIWQIEKKKILS